jgi:translocation and assembly module TamB
VAETVAAEPREAVRRYRLRRGWPRRLAIEFATLLLAIIALAAIGLVLLDTAPGHRFVVDRISKIETASGLRIRIGRIDGSIFGESRLKNVAVLDQRGVFLTSPEIDLDWAPGAWLYNALHIDRVSAERVRLHRLPALKATGRRGQILPRFNIHIGSLDIQRLELAPAVTGVARSGMVHGSADVRSGRAMVDLRVVMDRGGDGLALMLDSEPDRDKFDLEVRLASPANGLVPAMVGTKRAIDLIITGDGGWSAWRGMAALDLSARPAARLQLTAQKGRYGLSGTLAAARFVTGRLQRLTAPTVKVKGKATLKDNVLDGQLTLGSAAVRAVATGAVDLGEGRYRDLKLGLDLLKPPALFTNMSGR